MLPGRDEDERKTLGSIVQTMRKRDKQRGRNFVKKRWISRSLLPFDARQRLGHTSLERSETKHNHGKDQRPGPGTTPIRAV